MPPLMKTLLRLVGWLLAGLLTLALLAVTIFWLINRKDEALLPEVAQAIVFTPPPPEAMQRNAYFVLLGLGAPVGEDALAAGMRFFAAQMQDYADRRQTGQARSSTVQAWPHQPLEINALRCPVERDDCLEYWLPRQGTIRAALKQYAHVLRRYHSLLEMPEYEEVIPPDLAVAMPYYGDLVAASDLVLMQAALLLHGGDAAQALLLLEHNARLHQRLMAGSRTLIGGMIALSMQMRQQRVVSHLLLRHPVLARAHTARWQAALSSEADLSAALAGEGRWMVSSFNTDMSQELRRLAAGNFPGKDEASMVARLEKTLAISQKFYLHHETLNRFYRAYRVAMRLADVPADQIDAQVTRVAQEQVIIGQPWWKRPYFGLRNQLGNILLEMGQPDIQRYIERAHDVEGHRRLVLLQLAAYSAGLEAADMPDWLAKSPEALRNPYTLAPMGWEADKSPSRAGGSLVFQGRQPQVQNPARSPVYRVRVFTH